MPKPTKPVCKYGSKCYRNNSKHREEYDHPEKKTEIEKEEKKNLKFEEKKVKKNEVRIFEVT